MNTLDPATRARILRGALASVPAFSRLLLPDRVLRPYQTAAAQAIIEAIRAGQGGQFAIVFARQSGKDEMIAQLIAYLLNVYQRKGGRIIVAQPSFKPQGLISRSRLMERLHNPLNEIVQPSVDDDGAIRLGRATVKYVSADPSASARGETASLLLLANEAQDIAPDHWDAVFDPMGASTNAVTVFSGTVWTSRTLLARQMAYLRELEAQDGKQRLFLADWRAVAALNPAYGQRVRQRIEQLGPSHPFIRSEYELHEIDADGALFSPVRQAAMTGQHPRTSPDVATTYFAPTSPSSPVGGASRGDISDAPAHLWGHVITVDVAGQDEAGEGALKMANARRDSTAATVFELWQPGNRQPEYRVVDRHVWTGASQTVLYERLTALQAGWKARRIIIDATGIGAGLASFLTKRLGERIVTPFVFSSASKSALGWAFLGLVDSGRYQEYVADGAADTRTFWQQVKACSYSVRNDGASRLIRWSVADPLIHDDLLMSAALIAVLEIERDGPARGRRIAQSLA